MWSASQQNNWHGGQILIYSICDIGLKRATNEDCIYTSPKLIAVADGMGGHKAGEIASKMACDELKKHENIKLSIGAIRKVFDSVNTAIYNAQRNDEALANMGTTLTAMWIDKKHVWIGHVGDSRAYRLRKDTMERLTNDHSFVGNLLQYNIITEEQARVHHLRNQIDRAMGIDSSIICDVIKTDIQPGDVFLLCSDGLSSMVPLEDIKEVLIRNNDEPAIALKDLAIHNGGADNISAIVYKED